MKTWFAFISLAIFLPLQTANAEESESMAATCEGAYNVEMRKLRSDETLNLCQFQGKPLLIVNTASHCGFTPQFKALEATHQAYKDQGLVVLGFPSDSFNQEAGAEEEIAEVCYINYGVSFTMFEPVSVRGDDANEFFSHFTAQSNEPKWNFNKYLIDENGQVVETFASRVSPDDAEFKEAIEALLL